jgi:hypothetical protein
LTQPTMRKITCERVRRHGKKQYEPGAIESIAISGRRIIYVSYDGILNLVDVVTGATKSYNIFDPKIMKLRKPEALLCDGNRVYYVVDPDELGTTLCTVDITTTPRLMKHIYVEGKEDEYGSMNSVEPISGVHTRTGDSYDLIFRNMFYTEYDDVPAANELLSLNARTHEITPHYIWRCPNTLDTTEHVVFGYNERAIELTVYAKSMMKTSWKPPTEEYHGAAIEIPMIAGRNSLAKRPGAEQMLYMGYDDAVHFLDLFSSIRLYSTRAFPQMGRCRDIAWINRNLVACFEYKYINMYDFRHPCQAPCVLANPLCGFIWGCIVSDDGRLVMHSGRDIYIYD